MFCVIKLRKFGSPKEFTNSIVQVSSPKNLKQLNE